ncbi:MAG: DUF4126 domain-containing protein [Burkholderiales bacterium]
MEAIAPLATAAGLGWASGIRLYAVVFFLGLLQFFGIYTLPADLQTLANPWVMGASGFMFLVEFLADKIPGFDSVWDAAHTFIRIPAGALLAAAAVAGGDASMGIAAGILGGAVAAGSHIAKASTRALINTSPEPLSNWTASFSEDALSIGAVWMALVFPLLMLVFLVIFFALAIWLLPKIWRGLKRVLSSIRQMTGSPA